MKIKTLSLKFNNDASITTMNKTTNQIQNQFVKNTTKYTCIYAVELRKKLEN